MVKSKEEVIAQFNEEVNMSVEELEEELKKAAEGFPTTFVSNRK